MEYLYRMKICFQINLIKFNFQDKVINILEKNKINIEISFFFIIILIKINLSNYNLIVIIT